MLQKCFFHEGVWMERQLEHIFFSLKMIWLDPVTSGIPWEAKTEMESSMHNIY